MRLHSVAWHTMQVNAFCLNSNHAGRYGYTPVNFINLTQTAAELLVFVQKFKMAADAILDLIFVQYHSQFVRRTIK